MVAVKRFEFPNFTRLRSGRKNKNGKGLSKAQRKSGSKSSIEPPVSFEMVGLLVQGILDVSWGRWAEL